MKRSIPYEKQSKRKRREQDLIKRETWGDIKPITRRIESAKIYRRKKARQEEGSFDAGPFICRFDVNIRSRRAARW